MALKYCEHDYPAHSSCPSCLANELALENEKLKAQIERLKAELARLAGMVAK
jgi:hypothetical protein